MMMMIITVAATLARGLSMTRRSHPITHVIERAPLLLMLYTDTLSTPDTIGM